MLLFRCLLRVFSFTNRNNTIKLHLILIITGRFFRIDKNNNIVQLHISNFIEDKLRDFTLHLWAKDTQISRPSLFVHDFRSSSSASLNT